MQSVIHEEREFAIAVDRIVGRSYWRVTTPGYRDYFGPRVVGGEQPEFFRALVAVAWWEMSRDIPQVTRRD